MNNTMSAGKTLVAASCYCLRLFSKKYKHSNDEFIARSVNMPLLSLGGKSFSCRGLVAMFEDVAKTNYQLTEEDIQSLRFEVNEDVSKDEMLKVIADAFVIVADRPKVISRTVTEPAPARKAWWRFW